MGYYYDQRPSKDDKPEQPGCLDAIVITRVVLQMLFWPVAAMFLVVADVMLIFYLFTLHPALALIPIALSAGGIMLIARWDQRRGDSDTYD